VLQIAPSGYWRHADQQRNPERRCARAQRNDALMPRIQRVWHANLQVYGADKDLEACPQIRNVAQRTIDWTFTRQDADLKLSRHFVPKLAF